MRIILYTGKGGVGKTSVAAASALKSAELGHKTIVLSTDIAHSLSDSFGEDLGDEPKPLAPNLWGQETDIIKTLETKWGTLRSWMAALMAWRGMSDIVADEMAILPGMEELANLLYILHYYDNKAYDSIMVDTAPTGETLRLLSFPDMLRWWMDKLFPLERKAAGVIRPVMRPILGDFPYPSDEVFDSAQHLFNELIRMRDLLANPDICSVRLVVNAEKMVINEAQRMLTYLNLYGYATDLVVCNRLIPDDVQDSYFDSWKRAQSRHYKTIEQNFYPLPIRAIPFFSEEVQGMDMLRKMADALYNNDDPSQVFFKGQVQQIEKRDGYYVLSLALPFVTRSDISITRNKDELYLQVGAYRRNLVLPHRLAALPVASAQFEGGKLNIVFGDEKSEKGSGEKARRRKEP